MITQNLDKFISDKLYQLGVLGVDISELELDHIGYQTSSKLDYETKKQQVLGQGTLKSENIVGGRRVAIYKLNPPFRFSNYLIQGFELIEPKTDQKVNSSLDHIEFVLKDDFHDYIKKHSNVNWDTSAMDRPEFAKLTIKFEDGTSVKFHTLNIFEEIPK